MVAECEAGICKQKDEKLNKALRVRPLVNVKSHLLAKRSLFFGKKISNYIYFQ